MGSGLLTVSLWGMAGQAAVLLVYWVSLASIGLRRDSDRFAVSCVALLTALSLSILASYDSQLVFKQGLWLLAGALCYHGVRVPWVARFALHRATMLFVGSLLGLLFALAIGRRIGGAVSWLPLGPVSFQPIEVVKVTIVLFWASVTQQSKNDSRVRALGIAATLVVFALLVMQRDLGPILLLTAIGLLLQGRSRISGRTLVLALPVAACFAIGAWFSFPHVRTRLRAWLDPWSEPFAAGYQTLQARFAMGRGGLFGGGWFTNGTPVPAGWTDLPLSVVAERLGFVGAVLVVCLLCVLSHRLLTAARSISDSYGRTIGFGYALLLLLQGMIVNAGTVGLLPLVGMTVPFLSYGGTALVTAMIKLALLMHLREEPRAELWGDFQPSEEASPYGKRPIWHLGAYSVIVLALVYWTVVAGPKVLTQPIFAARSGPGPGAARAGIVDRNGEILTAVTEYGTRSPVLRSLGHVVGYSDPLYGVAGLEAAFDAVLSGPRQTLLGTRLTGSQKQSRPVTTTLDVRLQAAVEQALAGRKGAAVVLNAHTGAVLAVASAPDFAVEDLAAAVNGSSVEAPMLNRAFQGLYPPGSAFKPVVMAAALETHAVTRGSLWRDEGKAMVGGRLFRNAAEVALGTLGPTEALAYSSNVIFAEVARLAGESAIRLQARRLGIGDVQALEVPYRRGSLGKMGGDAELAAVGIGQGKVVVTPLEMAVVAASIANGGYRVWPHLVEDTARDGVGFPPEHMRPLRAMSRETARLIADGMRLATREGTAAGIGPHTLWAGKTGTAENPHGEAHSWFIGFAPAYRPQIAIAVVIENGGSGAGAAAPVAFHIVTAALEQPLVP